MLWNLTLRYTKVFSSLSFPFCHAITGSAGGRKGVAVGGENDLVHLIFVVAVPQRLVNDYLICVGTLARLLWQEKRGRSSWLRPRRSNSLTSCGQRVESLGASAAKKVRAGFEFARPSDNQNEPRATSYCPSVTTSV